MVIELRVVQFWSEIILVISNRTRAVRSFDFEITCMILDQIALHSVQLPLFIVSRAYIMPVCREVLPDKEPLVMITSLTNIRRTSKKAQ